MSIELCPTVVEFSLIPAALNRYFIYYNRNLEVTIEPGNDIDLQGYRIKAPANNVEIVIGFDLSGDGLECRVYNKGERKAILTLRSTNGDQRKTNLHVLIDILEGAVPCEE